MTYFPFHAGVYPDVLSHEGWTYHVIMEGGNTVGLVVRRWRDGDALNAELVVLDTDVRTKGLARLAVVNGEVLVAYSRDIPRSEVVVWNVTLRQFAPWTVSDGFSLVWGTGSSEGWLAVQVALGGRWKAVGAHWPAKPTEVVGDGEATGLSRFKNGVVRTIGQDEREFRIIYGGSPCFVNDIVFGQAEAGGVLVFDRASSHQGILSQGVNTLAPRATRQANGLYTVTAYNVDSHGAVASHLWVDVDPLEVEMPAPSPLPQVSVAPYTKPKAIGVIFGSSDQYGYHPSKGNCEVLFDDFEQMVTKRPVIVSGSARNIPPAMRLGSWSDSLAGDETQPEPQFRYWDGRHYTDRIFPKPEDVRLFQCYPFKGETPTNFEISMHNQLDRFNGRKILVAKFYPGNPPEVFTEAELVPYFPVYDDLLRRDDVDGMFAFDHARSGLKTHPLWMRWYEAFAAASPGLPNFTIPEPPPPTPKPVDLEEPKMPVLPEIVSLRRKHGFVNIDPANGKVRENAPAVGADEQFSYVDGGFKHKASGKWFSVDSNGHLSSKTAMGPDEKADVCRGRFALWFNEFQGLAQVAAAFVICDQNGNTLPLR